jgi:hypothetical protein
METKQVMVGRGMRGRRKGLERMWAGWVGLEWGGLGWIGLDWIGLDLIWIRIRIPSKEGRLSLSLSLSLPFS